MQFTSFELGEEVKLSFNLAISGTSSQPTEVRVTLGDKLKLLAPAKLIQTGEYEVTFPILSELFAQGEHVLTIEVLLNGKLFIPVKQRVSIGSGGITVQAVESKKVEQPQPTAKPIQNEAAQPAVNSKTVIEKPKIQFTKPIINKKPVSEIKLDFNQFDTMMPQQVKKQKEKLLPEAVKVVSNVFKIQKTKIIEK
jgi:hypothetical protein